MGTELDKILEHLRAAKELMDQVEEDAATKGLEVDMVNLSTMSETLDEYIQELIYIESFTFHRIDGDDDNDDYDPIDEW